MFYTKMLVIRDHVFLLVRLLQEAMTVPFVCGTWQLASLKSPLLITRKVSDL